ncbi:hypothetical protein GCM10010349_77480 [Streptomyces flavofungini]|nr:hypothetical protein GCM10010349_77480 [Streptomyces flavofungini]
MQEWAEQQIRLPGTDQRKEVGARRIVCGCFRIRIGVGLPGVLADRAVPDDLHHAISQASRVGRHTEAASIAAAWEQTALRQHGTWLPEHRGLCRRGVGLRFSTRSPSPAHAHSASCAAYTRAPAWGCGPSD